MRATLLVSTVTTLALIATTASALDHRWSAPFGDGADQIATCAAMDDGGSVVVLGHFNGTVDFGGGALTCAGPADATYLARLGPSGNHLWSRALGDSINLGTNKLCVDADGNTLLALDFRGTVEPGGGAITTQGFRDGFIAKYDAAGNPLWARGFGGPSALVIVDAAGVDGAGNLVVAGTYTGNVDFGGTTLTYQPFATNMFVVKFDTDGEHMWSRRLTGGLVVITAITGDAAGNTVVTGHHGSAFDFGGGPLDADLYDIFLARYDPSGNHLWSQSFGAEGTYQHAYDVGTDDSGGIYITGHFSSTLNLGGGDLVSAGGWDMYVARFESDGSHAWSKRFGDSNTQRSYSLAVSGNGDVTIAGHFFGSIDFGGGMLTADPLDFTLARFDPDGNHVWSRILDIYNLGMKNDKPYAIAVASDAAGDVACTGTFAQAIDCGGGDLNAAGSWDTFVATFAGDVTAVPRSPAPAPALHVFPNPFNPTTTVVFTLERPGVVTLTVHDVSGRLVRTLSRDRYGAGEHAVRWDGRNDTGAGVASGVYFARCRVADAVSTHSLVLLK
jgi:hypothetical protein